MKRLQRGIGLLLLLAGLTAFLAPDLYSLVFQQQTKEVVREFREAHGVHEYSIENAQKSTPSEDRSSPPLEQIRQYNNHIFASKQAGLVDAWSFTENPFGFALEDDLFGCITIPAMDVELPLYLGATEANMARGAVVLGQTSVPIGGTNSNSVIAAHRGYRVALYFREIERLHIGDSVEVTNLWETLRYTVTDIAVIRPDDLSAVQIQGGRDLLTLMTCHPYRSGGKYRYVVLCERTGTAPTDGDANQTISTNRCEIPAVEAIPLTSSEPELRYEVRLFAGFTTKSISSAYNRRFDHSDYGTWLALMQAQSDFHSDVVPTTNDRVLTLSTCAYSFEDARYVVMGTLNAL